MTQHPVESGYMLAHLGQEYGPHGFDRLREMAAARQLRGEAQVREVSSGGWRRACEVPGLFSARDWLVASLLSVFLGTLGADRFYLGRPWLGLLKLAPTVLAVLTLAWGALLTAPIALAAGLVLVVVAWGLWLVDLALVLFRRVRDSEGLPLA